MKQTPPISAQPPLASENDSRSRILLAFIFAAASLLYILLNPQYRTGYFNDDAMYVIGARDLWEHSAFHSLLLRPDYPLPGLPLLLAPMIKLVEPHWTALEWIAVVIGALSLFVFMLWTRQWLSSRESVAAVALLAFNPAFARFTGILMPETFYAAAVVGSFWLMTDLLKTPSRSKTLALGGLLGWATLIRPEGILLLLSVLGGLLFRRETRRTVPLLLIPVAGWAGVMFFWWRRYWSARTEYGSDVSALAAYWTHHTLDNAAFFFRLTETFLGRALLGLKRPHTSSAMALGAVLTLLCLFFLVVGFRHLWKERRVPREALASALVFYGSFILVHLFWHVDTRRYAVPLIPLSFILIVRGVGVCTALLKYRRVWSGLALGMAIRFFGVRNSAALHESLVEPNPMKSPPWQSLAWLDRHASKDTHVVSTIASNIELYADRPSDYGLLANNVDMFEYRLQSGHFGYIVDRQIGLVTPGVTGTENLNAVWVRMRDWMVKYPQRFPLVFEDPQEKTKIYQVSLDAHFQSAYALLILAADDYDAERDASAFQRVRACLRLAPELGSADNLLGALYVRARDFARAEAAFQMSSAVLPTSTYGRLNLATLYELQQRPVRAEESLQQAMAAAAAGGTEDLVAQKIRWLRSQWTQRNATMLIDYP